MPRPDGAAADTSFAAEARPQDSLFKPKGDRLWATVALVFALITSALAYYAGTLRRDPELVLNIQNVFQQDSGLKDKPLKIHSDGRTVTVAGVVTNEAEHAKAVQEALKVRGVKQLIDQIQVAPLQSPQQLAPPASSATLAAPEVVAPPSLNATVSIGVGRASSATSSQKTAASKKVPNLQKAPTVQTPGPPKATDSEKHKGFLGLLKKGKDNLRGNAGETHKADAQKPNEPSKPADAQKHGLFHFLKKDKNKENNTSVKPAKNGTNKNNKDPGAR